jgi:hypothetical protein
MLAFAVTTDFRTVLSELVRGHLGAERFKLGVSGIQAKAFGGPVAVVARRLSSGKPGNFTFRNE